MRFGGPLIGLVSLAGLLAMVLAAGPPAAALQPATGPQARSALSAYIPGGPAPTPVALRLPKSVAGDANPGLPPVVLSSHELVFTDDLAGRCAGFLRPTSVDAMTWSGKVLWTQLLPGNAAVIDGPLWNGRDIVFLWRSSLGLSPPHASTMVILTAAGAVVQDAATRASGLQAFLKP